MPAPEGRIRAGQWLSQQRKARGILQGRLAHQLGISQQSLSGYENGRAWVPDDIAAKIARLFGLAESVVRRELGLHVPSDLAASTEPTPMPVVDREVIELPAGIRLTPSQRRAIVAMVMALLQQDATTADARFPGAVYATTTDVAFHGLGHPAAADG